MSAGITGVRLYPGFQCCCQIFRGDRHPPHWFEGRKRYDDVREVRSAYNMILRSIYENSENQFPLFTNIYNLKYI